MRKYLAGVAGALALGGVATAAEDPGNRDVAAGAGTNQFAVVIGDTRFAFSATSDPSGVRPRGYVRTEGDADGIGPMEPFTAAGHVTCLRVAGNRASFKWRFEHATGPAESFGGIQVFVEDNGEPRRGVTVDATALDPPQPAAVFEADADRCDDPALRSYDANESGNLTVRDAMQP